MDGLFHFPDPVNETSARLVAGGVVVMATASIALDRPALMVPLTYGFVARVTTGPTLSPLGQLATKVVTPRLPVRHRYSPGPPKRLAQGMGLAMSSMALVLHYGFGRRRAARTALGALIGAASLEAFLGVCLACRMFPYLMRAGIIPREVCEECADIGSRRSQVQATHETTPPAVAAV